ncbi:MAG: ABC transporter ATP-binding protein [Oligoflexia bacterium]|nr:ABC transporter ATP-binding protein [Oligoflexia bacterium]
MKVQLCDIQVRFGHLLALGGVSLDLRAGAVTVLVGPNGAGKSTLMGVLLGLVRPDSGHVMVDGRPHQGLPRMEREKLGYLPEAVAFADNLSGRQVMRFFTRARGLSRSRADAVLSRVGLAQAAGRAVRGYSRGMRQRLGLGVAILSEPALLVLDEPTGGLDQQGLTLLWEILSEWREAGRTVLLSTHDLALIERRADHICVLHDGLVQAQGSPDQLRRDVGLPVQISVTIDDDAAVGALVAQLQRGGLADVQIATDIDGRHRHLVMETAPDDLLQVLRIVDGAPSSVRDLRVAEPGLDDVYERLLEVTR